MPLIVIEGIDGSGTTLHSQQLQKYFGEEMLRSSVWTSLPSDGPFGQVVRQVFEGKFPGVEQLPNWRTMLYLFQADDEHHRDRLQLWLDNGLWVISDRYWLSRMTYQVTSAMLQDGIDQYEVAALVEKLNEHMPVPDATIILDVSVEEGLRRKQKESDHFEKKEFLEKVRERYLEVTGPNIRHVDTESKSPEETQKEIQRALMEMGY